MSGAHRDIVAAATQGTDSQRPVVSGPIPVYSGQSLQRRPAHSGHSMTFLEIRRCFGYSSGSFGRPNEYGVAGIPTSPPLSGIRLGRIGFAGLPTQTIIGGRS
jgi:hypothetical protein